MGLAKQQPPVKLIIGCIFNNTQIFNKTRVKLQNRFGIIDFESQEIDFNYTDYYENEFGKLLKRKFISFKKLIPPENLYKIKTYTNILEQKLTRLNKRQINLDPGYLDLAKLVLATTKDFSHRIYLNKGIYAEITLTYHNQTFVPLDWTYPDYRTPEYIEILNSLREIYANQIQNSKISSLNS